MKIFTVYDCKAKTYLNPFVQRTSAEAIRGFESAANDTQSSISQYPEDFTLMEIGEWDETNATIIPNDAKISLATAIELKKEK